MATAQDVPGSFPSVDDRMTVRVRDHAAEAAAGGHGPFVPAIRTVTIPAACPQCGGSRGVPWGFRQGEDGVWFDIDRWTNPCGHVDYYRAVIDEAAGGAR